MSVIMMAATLCVFSNQANAAALYKWIDENGQIRYSDRLPAKQVKKKHQQLNTQGVVLSTREAAKSEEELAVEAEAQLKLEREQAEIAKAKEMQYKNDQVLLMTFSSEEELGLAHKNRVDVLDSVIELITRSLVSTQQKLDEVETTAQQEYISKGQEVPGGLAQKIEHFTRKLENRSEQLDLKAEEKNKLNEQYELDLARFRDLKAAKN